MLFLFLNDILWDRVGVITTVILGFDLALPWLYDIRIVFSLPLRFVDVLSSHFLYILHFNLHPIVYLRASTSSTNLPTLLIDRSGSIWSDIVLSGSVFVRMFSALTGWIWGEGFAFICLLRMLLIFASLRMRCLLYTFHAINLIY